jgi:hypothetical protein
VVAEAEAGPEVPLREDGLEVRIFGLDVSRAKPTELAAPLPEVAEVPLGPVEEFRAYANGDQPKALKGTSGVDGDSRYNEVYEQAEELNTALQGRLKFKVYQEMRRSDTAVRSLLYLVKLPIRAAQWDVLPVSEDKLDKTVAEALGWQFGIGHGDDDPGRLDMSWEEQLAQSLLMLDFGAMFEEMIWGDTEEWADSTGETHRIRPLLRLAPRYPSTVADMPEGIKTDEKTGLISELTQDLPDAKPIPGEKLSWYVYEREPPGWFGTSLLRSVYGPWKLKKGLMVAAAIGWDRYAAGVPLVRYPRNQQGAEEKANQIGRNYRTHERAYVSMEGPPPTPNTDGWDLEIKSGTGAMADPIPLLNFYNQEIATAGLQMFSELGTTGTGARAVGEVLADPYYLATQAVAKYIAEQKTKRLFETFVAVNFPKGTKVPKLVVSKIRARNVQLLLDGVTKLADAGVPILQRIEVVNDLLEELGLPPIPEDEANALVSEGTPPSPPREKPPPVDTRTENGG